MNEWLVILIVAPFIFGTIGGVLQRVVLGQKPYPTMRVNGKERVNFGHKGRQWFWVSVPLQYLIGGAVAGIIGYSFSIPVPEAVFGEERIGAMLAYTFAGGIAMVGYDSIVKTIKRFIDTIRL